MAARFSCSEVMAPHRLNTVVRILHCEVMRQRKLFAVLRAAAVCLQTIPGALVMANCPAAALSDADGSLAATRSLLLSASEALCAVILGDFVGDDSAATRYVRPRVCVPCLMCVLTAV